MASSGNNPLNSPRLVAHHARVAGRAGSFREKEFGIWQSWTWRSPRGNKLSLRSAFSVLVLAKVTISPSSGAKSPVSLLGDGRGAIRRRDTGAALSGLGGRGNGHVIDHCSARFVVAQDQEQVDKIIEVKDKLPGVEQIIFLDPRGMRKYDRTGLTDYKALQMRGREKAKHRPELEKRLARQSGQHLCDALHREPPDGQRVWCCRMTTSS